MPPLSFLMECFDADVEAGLLVWRNRPIHHFKHQHAQRTFNSRFAGTRAGTDMLSNIGVRAKRKVVVNRLQIAEHWIIWVMSGKTYDPTMELDHINRDPWDNRISNLRLATSSQNNMNMGMPSHNTSGFRGVGWHTRDLVWRATIQVNGKQIHLGSFSTKEDAMKARIEAEKKYHAGFSAWGEEGQDPKVFNVQAN